MNNGTPQPLRRSPALGIHAPAAKRHPYRSRLQYAVPEPPPTLHYVSTDTETDDCESTGSSGACVYWAITCPGCGCAFTTDQDGIVKEMDARRSLGASSRLATTSALLPESGDQGPRTLDDRNTSNPARQAIRPSICRIDVLSRSLDADNSE